MLPESKNIQTIADNIRSLENQINALDVEIPPHASADAGKILAVDSEGDLEWREETQYIPPAYSAEEVNTGQKWIDGKDIYSKAFTGDFSEITQTGIQNIGNADIDTIIHLEGFISTSSKNSYLPSPMSINKSTRAVLFQSISATYSLGNYIATMLYTKPDPEPSSETKSKKGGTKK